MKPEVPNHSTLRKLQTGLLALKELGFQELSLYGRYRLGILTGYFRLLTPIPKKPAVVSLKLNPIFSLPDKNALLAILEGNLPALIAEADEIVSGFYRIFGGEPVKLNLAPVNAPKHWTLSKVQPGEDIKLIWEPARFGWAFTLGRAFIATGDERYPESFWHYWEEFMNANPVNCGPNWESGQEVALRLIAWIFTAQVFQGSVHSTPQRFLRLLNGISDHAERIPATLIYARAQNNNHLISEACGLYLSGVSLPDHPKAAHWKQLGWKWLEYSLANQIAPDGTYVQHSMNYHRMVLHLALLGQAAARKAGEGFLVQVNRRLDAAARWMIAQMDSISGETPNLGNNDGANILPLSAGSFRDYRSIGQAAAVAFMGQSILPAGPWEELAVWLGVEIGDYPKESLQVNSPAVKRLGSHTEWATLRTVQFSSRPAHADQLHVDLWFEGRNILLDPGTYSYNLNAPWNNSLVGSQFHNCLTIDGQQPMMRAGRFLWLQWDQAHWIEDGSLTNKTLIAEHNGYKRYGITHRRSLEWIQSGVWEVTDWLTSTGGKHVAEVNWMILDGEPDLHNGQFILFGEGYKLSIMVQAESDRFAPVIQHRIVRAGRGILGEPPALVNEGWYSPTYFLQVPAVAYRATIPFNSEITIKTRILVDKNLI